MNSSKTSDVFLPQKKKNSKGENLCSLEVMLLSVSNGANQVYSVVIYYLYQQVLEFSNKTCLIFLRILMFFKVTSVKNERIHINDSNQIRKLTKTRSRKLQNITIK